MESVGFKEWSSVCDALGRGEQSVILRKGGLAEGHAGFSFRHREFFLFPTFFHEQIGKVRNGAPSSQEEARILTFSPGEKGFEATLLANARRDDEIAISLYAKVEQTVRINSLAIAEALAPLHLLVPDVVRERFEYKEEGLNVAFVRVFRLERPWILANEKWFGGCRSWVQLPQPPQIGVQPVLADIPHRKRFAQFGSLICHPERSEAESKDPEELTFKFRDGIPRLRRE
jgi:hypothetical protein